MVMLYSARLRAELVPSVNEAVHCSSSWRYLASLVVVSVLVASVPVLLSCSVFCFYKFRFLFLPARPVYSNAALKLFLQVPGQICSLVCGFLYHKCNAFVEAARITVNV